MSKIILGMSFKYAQQKCDWSVSPMSEENHLELGRVQLSGAELLAIQLSCLTKFRQPILNDKNFYNLGQKWLIGSFKILKILLPNISWTSFLKSQKQSLLKLPFFTSKLHVYILYLDSCHNLFWKAMSRICCLFLATTKLALIIQMHVLRKKTYAWMIGTIFYIFLNTDIRSRVCHGSLVILWGQPWIWINILI